MIKRFVNISSCVLIWITIIHFMSVGYISLHLSDMLNETTNVNAFADWFDLHEEAVSTFSDLYDVEHESNGSETNSQPAEDDPSHTNEDLIASLHSLNRLQISADNKRIAGLFKSSHEEPHIEFLSPPPELIHSYFFVG